MKFTQNNHPTRLFGPTCLIGTWEYFYLILDIFPTYKSLELHVY